VHQLSPPFGDNDPIPSIQDIATPTRAAPGIDRDGRSCA
jgi:hypothetical protein